MKNLFVLFFILFSNMIFCQVSEKVLNDNFLKQLNTSPSYYLIIYEDLNTHKVREICIQDDDFIKAVEIENNITFNSEKDKNLQEYYFRAAAFIKKNGSRNFKFKNNESLEVLNNYYISDNEMKDFIKRTNITSLLKTIEKDKNWFLETTEENYKDEKINAYILSKKGYRIGYFLNCFGPSGLFCMSCLEKNKL